MGHTFDIIGDIHGELPALQALGHQLGYRVDHDWTHPDGRFLIFLGDLVDRGAHSLEVAELVRGLVEERRAVCIMGNHEYNLVAYHLKVPGYEKPKHSNAPTIREIAETPGRWLPVLDFFRDLPIGIELPDLRIIHACWNQNSLEQTRSLLHVPRADVSTDAGAMDWVQGHVCLRSPFAAAGLLPDLPDKVKPDDAPHEVLMKGFEVPAPSFKDNDGKLRHRIRAVWWRDTRHLVLTDKVQVFGHYWNTPPIAGDFAPPHPSGHPDLRTWGTEMLEKCPPSGRLPLTGDVACVDFHGITRASSDRACIGALRWPEREIAWASGRKTASNSDED